MSSTFVTLDPTKSETKKLFGEAKPTPVWLQFVTGKVTAVVNNSEDIAFNNTDGVPSRRFINSIYAKPHVSSGVESNTAGEERYYPMFRGIVDVPMIGDQVLLCTFGKTNYYLGPVNTAGVPGRNPDTVGSRAKNLVTGPTQMSGTSTNWIDRGSQRLEKKYNLELDDPDGVRAHFTHPITGNDILGDTHGDFLIEGRHGNSIRIGSRNINPYITISNGNSDTTETWFEGSIFSMFERGTIRQHLPKHIEYGEYVVSSDKVEESHPRMIGELYNYDYGIEGGPETTEDQIFITSDKITIDSRTDSIFLSAMTDIVIGTGNNFTLKAKNVCMLDAKNVFIGNAGASQPMVLGYKLTEVLQDIIKAIGQLQVGATVGGISAPVAGSGSPGWLELDQVISNKIMEMLSDYHYIEDNETKK